MISLYRYFQNHKWVLYCTILLTLIGFGYLALQCQFEENIAKLLPPTDKNANIDLAFSDLKVKDKVFVQAISRTDAEASEEELIGAMDMFMQLALEDDEQKGNIGNTLYELDPMDILSLAEYLPQIAPTYLDFTDEEMDSLLTAEHLTKQIAIYTDFIQTDLGEQLYDLITYDPAGIMLSKLQGSIPMRTDGKGRIRANHLFSEDGTVCQGFMSPNLSSMNSGAASGLLSTIKKAKKATEAEYSNIEILYHGTTIQSANNARRIKTDLLITIGSALAIILLLLGLCFKQPSSYLLILLPIAYGAVFALAGMYLFRGGMSVMALGIGAIVLGVALSYCLHVVVHFKYVGNAEQTIREQAKPVFLGSLTTIGAFAGLLFTESSLLQDFGLFALLAMIGTTIASLIFMPHFFPKENKKNERAFSFLERINSAEIDRKPWVLAAMGIFVLGTIVFSPYVEFDPDLKHINYTAPEVLRSQKLWAEKNNNGMFQQYFAAVAPTLDEALDALPEIEAECERLKVEGKISSYSKMSALMPNLNTQEARIEHWQSYFTQDKQAIAKRNIAIACRNNGVDEDMFDPFIEAMQTDYEPELIAESGLIPEVLQSNLVEQVGDKWLVFLPVRFEQDHLNEVNSLLTAVPNCLVLDPFYYTIDTVAMMNTDFNTILGISAIFVLIVLLLSFRRITIALIAFLPMTLSWYVVLGAMYLTGHQFNLINIVVSSFIFGIGVDYSIFIMDGLIAKAKGNATNLLAYHKTAITISATILIICMFSLLFAVHPAMQSIGFASLVGMITTMMLSYTLEPWLFRQAMKWKWLRKKIINTK